MACNALHSPNKHAPRSSHPALPLPIPNAKATPIPQLSKKRAAFVLSLHPKHPPEKRIKLTLNMNRWPVVSKRGEEVELARETVKPKGELVALKLTCAPELPPGPQKHGVETV